MFTLTFMSLGFAIDEARTSPDWDSDTEVCLLILKYDNAFLLGAQLRHYWR